MRTLIAILCATSLYGQETQETDVVIKATVPKAAVERRYATRSLTASNAIYGAAVYRAGSAVQLREGFHAGKGTLFHAAIAPPASRTKSAAPPSEKKTPVAPEAEASVPSRLETYPNPTSGLFQVRLTDRTLDHCSIELRSMSGQLLYESPIAAAGSTSFRLDISAYPVGTYFLRLVAADTGEVFTGKVIKATR